MRRSTIILLDGHLRGDKKNRKGWVSRGKGLRGFAIELNNNVQ